ncbi:hypothetical protein BKA70DRAFT_1242312 [Coprinopsis sp. MPI-PUGE-AT-0042]|nr:hypothetical protein BKA70DRAFT_1242312 [Coprinopsis sp. MPI-PUGE-AT-0042]
MDREHLYRLIGPVLGPTLFESVANLAIPGHDLKVKSFLEKGGALDNIDWWHVWSVRFKLENDPHPAVSIPKTIFPLFKRSQEDPSTSEVSPPKKLRLSTSPDVGSPAPVATGVSELNEASVTSTSPSSNFVVRNECSSGSASSGRPSPRPVTTAFLNDWELSPERLALHQKAVTALISPVPKSKYPYSSGDLGSDLSSFEGDSEAEYKPPSKTAVGMVDAIDIRSLTSFMQPTPGGRRATSTCHSVSLSKYIDYTWNTRLELLDQPYGACGSPQGTNGSSPMTQRGVPGSLGEPSKLVPKDHLPDLDYHWVAPSGNPGIANGKSSGSRRRQADNPVSAKRIAGCIATPCSLVWDSEWEWGEE